MQFLDETSREEIIFAWLRSESHKLPGGAPDSELIENFDRSNVNQNAARERLLRKDFREPILKDLPLNASARRVLIEEADLPKLYIIPTPEWYPDTGDTFKLTSTAGSLRRGRRMSIPAYRTGSIGVYHTVQEKMKYLRGYDAMNTEELLVLVSPTEDGPYTIIDGNHRAALSSARIMGPGRCHDLGTTFWLLCHLGVCGGIRQAEWAGPVSLRVPAARARQPP